MSFTKINNQKELNELVKSFSIVKKELKKKSLEEKTGDIEKSATIKELTDPITQLLSTTPTKLNPITNKLEPVLNIETGDKIELSVADLLYNTINQLKKIKVKENDIKEVLDNINKDSKSTRKYLRELSNSLIKEGAKPIEVVKLFGNINRNISDSYSDSVFDISSISEEIEEEQRKQYEFIMDDILTNEEVLRNFVEKLNNEEDPELIKLWQEQIDLIKETLIKLDNDLIEMNFEIDESSESVIEEDEPVIEEEVEPVIEEVESVIEEVEPVIEETFIEEVEPIESSFIKGIGPLELLQDRNDKNVYYSFLNTDNSPGDFTKKIVVKQRAREFVKLSVKDLNDNIINDDITLHKNLFSFIIKNVNDNKVADSYLKSLGKEQRKNYRKLMNALGWTEDNYKQFIRGTRTNPNAILAKKAGVKLNVLTGNYGFGIEDKSDIRTDIKIYNNNDDLIDRASIIVGSIIAGNNSLIVKSELNSIIDILLNKQIINYDDHKIIYNTYIK
jgi:hypothetical protein